MRRTTIADGENALFDLPLGPVPTREPAPDAARDDRAEGGARRGRRSGAGNERAEPEPLPLFGEPRGGDPEAGEGRGELEPTAADEEPGDDRKRSDRRAALLHRYAAGVIDLSILALTLGALLGGVVLMGLPLRPAQAPAYGLVLALFSFLYHVLALAFWGQTPGMAHERLRARSRDGHPLTFGQAALRWLGAAATVLLLGLPTLLALLGGGSLADRVSGSEIVPTRPTDC